MILLKLSRESNHWLVAAALSVFVAVALQYSGQFSGTATPATTDVTRGPIFVDPDIKSAQNGSLKIIVQKWDPADRSPGLAILKLGGRVTRELQIVNGFAATVPASSAGNLVNLTGAKTITIDREVKVQGGGDLSNLKSVYPKEVRATKMWSEGFKGAGVTVALIDTGIADVPDLNGRVLPVYDDIRGTYSPCVNLSGEAHCRDSYGHGTFIAGIIAGSGASSNGKWMGIAPEANLVSLKISGYDGSADVSSVLAGIQWVVSFKDRYGIKVLNLSLGTNGNGSYRTDPFNYAVQRAWAAGVVVIVSASNRGPDPMTVSKPGDDPYVITVGAVDDMGTPGIGDDQLPNFSSRGPTKADQLVKPDLAAPGGHIVSLRAPGSAIDSNFPNYIDTHYRKGSGTSMSAGVVSGSVALMLQAQPAMTPDRVKFALMSTARTVASAEPLSVGTGMPEVYNATFAAPAGLANGGLDRSSGMGSLDASRGDVRVHANDPLFTVVNGTLTLQLLLWDSISLTTGDWNGSSWYGSSWYGSSWYGSSWYGSSWYGAWE